MQERNSDVILKRRARKVTVEEIASPLSTRSGRPTHSTQASRASAQSSDASSKASQRSSRGTQPSSRSTQRSSHSSTASQCSSQGTQPSSCSTQRSSHSSTASQCSSQGTQRSSRSTQRSSHSSTASQCSSQGTQCSSRSTQRSSRNTQCSSHSSMASQRSSRNTQHSSCSTCHVASDEWLAGLPASSATSAPSGQSRRGGKKDSSKSQCATRALQQSQSVPQVPAKTRSSQGEDVASSMLQAPAQGKSSQETAAATLTTPAQGNAAWHAGSPSTIQHPAAPASAFPLPSSAITAPTLMRATSVMTGVACPEAVLSSTVPVGRGSSHSLSAHHHSPGLVSTKAKRTSSISGPRMDTAKMVSDAGRVSLKSQKRSSSLKSGKEMEVGEQPVQGSKPNRTKLRLQKHAAKKNFVSSSSFSSGEISTHSQPAFPTSTSAQPSSSTGTHSAEVKASIKEKKAHAEENSRLEEADTQVPGGGTPSKSRKLNSDQGAEQQSQDAGRMGDEAKSTMAAKEQSSGEEKQVTDDTSQKGRARTRVKQQGNATATSSCESSAAAQPSCSTRSKSPTQHKNQTNSVKVDVSSFSADDGKEERTQLRACTKTLTSSTAPADGSASMLSGVAASAVHTKEVIMARIKTCTKSHKPATAASETSSLVSKESMSFSLDQREETSTRTKNCTKSRKPAANPFYVIPIISGSSDEESQKEILVRQSQRTKTRKPADGKVESSPVQEEKQHRARQTEDSADSGILSTRPSCEELLTSQEPEMLCLTRTKTREFKSTAACVQADCSTTSQSTRTKSRKRQAEESEQPPCHKHSRTTASLTEMGNTMQEITFDLTEMDVDKSWEKDSDTMQTPSPPGMTGKVVLSHPSSFLNTLRSQKTTPNNLVTSSGSSGRIRTFIKRKTPIRIVHKTKLEMKQKELLEKRKKEEERLKNREERMKQISEGIKQKREERLKHAAKLREMQQKKTQQVNSEIVRKMEMLQTIDKSKKEKIREQLEEKAHNRLKKQTETEARRKLEEQEGLKKQLEKQEEDRQHAEQREFEEAERQRRLAEERQNQEEWRAETAWEHELEAKRLRLQELEKMKEDKEKAAVQEKVEREKAEREKKKEREAFLQSEMQKLKDLENRRRQLELQRQAEAREEQAEAVRVLSRHQQHLQSLATRLTTANPHSYPITQTKTNYDNYDISQLNSGDETDDDEHPRKPIPTWAQGSQLKVALIHQCYHPPNLDTLFPPVPMPDLAQLFLLQRPRFQKRTSSACWDSPLSKHW